MTNNMIMISNHMFDLQTSNRSHCMFTIYVERNIKTRNYPDRIAAKLNLVDLAGCERMKCTDAINPCEKDICSINKSLSFLEQVIYHTQNPVSVCILLCY